MVGETNKTKQQMKLGRNRGYLSLYLGGTSMKTCKIVKGTVSVDQNNNSSYVWWLCCSGLKESMDRSYENLHINFCLSKM